MSKMIVMASWRMALRSGYRGEDMYPRCRREGLVAITYIPLLKTNLGLYGHENRPPGWEDLAPSQKGSINKFAWQIRAGDSIYVKDSDRPNLLVGLGHVVGKGGELGYFYDRRSPIRTSDGVVWRHLIRVIWEDAFQEIPYKDLSANTTVLSLDEKSLIKASAQSKRAGYRKHGLAEAEVDLALGLEEAYPRATPGIIRLIVPKHIHLSKAFQNWLRVQHAIDSRREVRQIDMEFMVGSERAMVEFKIAYNQKTKAAVREALGQILEYNHYPKREATKMWFLVLDEVPSADDCAFVAALRTELEFPIYLGWKSRNGFRFHPQSPLG
jgi:hypothetical protein